MPIKIFNDNRIGAFLGEIPETSGFPAGKLNDWFIPSQDADYNGTTLVAGQAYRCNVTSTAAGTPASWVRATEHDKPSDGRGTRAELDALTDPYIRVWTELDIVDGISDVVAVWDKTNGLWLRRIGIEEGVLNVLHGVRMIGVYQVISDVDSEDSSVLRITTMGAKYGTPPYSDWEVFLRFHHADQNDRTLSIKGDTLSQAPTSIVDSSGLVTLAKTGTFYGNNATAIGGPQYDNGDTVKAVGGTMQYLDIVSSVSDLYGDIDITVSVEDSTSEVATVNIRADS